jgi:glycosyltransferase involved in cell wall biosynthesis
MKVLQINSVCGRGSTGRIVLDIHNELMMQGHQSFVAYGREPAVDCNGVIRIGSKYDVYLHVLRTRIFDEHGFGSRKATAKFIKKIDEIKPDIIHLHNIHGYYLNIEVLFNYFKEVQVPMVWTLHDCWSFTGHCAYFDYVGCSRWREGCFRCPQKSRYPSSWFFDKSLVNWKKKKELFAGFKNMTLVTPSRWLAELVKQSFLKDYHVVVIPNGIDTSVFKPTPSDFRKRYGLENKFIILGVANVWEERKGLKYFLELSKMLNDDEVIVLVGLNEKQKKYLPKNIIGISRTSSVRELAGIYTAADVFVNPTLEDNYPTVNLEAQACGTLVITFDSGGAKETIIEEGFTGCAIPKEEKPRKILSILQELKNNKEGPHRFKSQRFVSISRSEMAHRYLDLYKACIGYI